MELFVNALLAVTVLAAIVGVVATEIHVRQLDRLRAEWAAGTDDEREKHAARRPEPAARPR